MTTPYQQQPHVPQAPGRQLGTYTSPIAVRRATFGDALASEWTKIRSVRSTMWTLGVLILLLVGLGLLIGFVVRSQDGHIGDTPVLSLGFYGVLLGLLCVITLGVLTISSEYGTGMIRTTLTACPSRGRILAAKSVVFFLLTFVIVAIATTLVAVVQASLVRNAPTPSGGEWLRATLGISLYVAMVGLLSLAVGALIRHSAGSITVMIGVVLLPLVLALFMFTDSLSGVREFLLNYSIPSQLGAFYGATVSDSGPSGWDPLWIMTGITAVALGGAFLSLNSRDV
ncbi:ABC transporter [Streptomyces xanthochromogenes]|uniref:ABC transporter permease n=1 Tax=Streptomyces xanthochromogenes TaxID=67384 RepID=UPI00167444A1|nr:ABC transporter permease [Streptomyces xanthochromogenes]GHB50276.1 ABC transporter [Streptomyces xanthochromogenes]